MANTHTRIAALLLFLLSVAAASGSPSAREKIQLNQGWKFQPGNVSPAPLQPGFDDSGWDRVNLPHTFRLTSLNLDDSTDTSAQETFHRDISWYRKSLTVNAKPEQKVFLEFEGAHQITDLWLNGKHVGQHAIGAYTPFHFELTQYLNATGENEIVLRLDNRKNENVPPDGLKADYVLFGGLYRDVYLVITDPIYIPFAWEKRDAGVRVTTPSVSHKGVTVSVQTAVRNTSSVSKKVEVVTRVIDAKHRTVLKLRKQLELEAGRDHLVTQTGALKGENFHLWSLDDPYLYRVRAEVHDGGKVVDHQEEPLGLRWFEMRPGVGFCLNGKAMELIGVNRHQHYPYIGDAVPDNLHRLDAILMKESGINLVRLAHYPHDDAFIEACDELGLLVAEEPPTWIHIGPQSSGWIG